MGRTTCERNLQFWGAERSEIKVFWGAFFSKKVRPCPYRRAAHEKKLGKQGLCPAFPGRRSARKVASQKLGREPAVCPLRPPLEGTSPKGGGETWLSLRESWHGAAVTERASCQPHRPLPWLSPLRARAPRSLILFWLTPIKVKAVGLCPTTCNPLKRVDLNFQLASLGLP